MNLWEKTKSLLGLTDEKEVDGYCVDHSGFSLRDELNYQMKRADEEEEKREENNKSAFSKEKILSKNSENSQNDVNNKYKISKIVDNLYNLGYDGGERLGYPRPRVSDYENRSSLGKAQAEAQRITPLKISDENKHQYVSCVGSYDGPVSALITGVAGVYKEGKDLIHKWNNPRYQTNYQVVTDSIKDIKNNAIGIAKGLNAQRLEDCNILLPQRVRHKK